MIFNPMVQGAGGGSLIECTYDQLFAESGVKLIDHALILAINRGVSPNEYIYLGAGNADFPIQNASIGKYNIYCNAYVMNTHAFAQIVGQFCWSDNEGRNPPKILVPGWELHYFKYEP